MATSFFRRLSTKITGILVVFFVVALTAIGMTLFVSWRLQGSAAAINDAGSERMRSYLIGYLMARDYLDGRRDAAVEAQVRDKVDEFERVLLTLERGDPQRPLFLPKEPEIRADVARLHRQWFERMKPLVLQILAADRADRQRALMTAYDGEVGQFVTGINALVFKMERSYARNTSLLRAFQFGLVVLALVGTIILIRFLFVVVVRPVGQLHRGIQRMAGEDFGARVPVASRDELGELADGFNQMAGHLEGVYATLEERVETKTRSLADRNSELALLYEITAFLNEQASVEELCRGFLRRVMAATGACGGAVRLFDAPGQRLYLQVHEGLSEDFVRNEQTLRCGECLCGMAAETASPLVCQLDEPPAGMTLGSCVRAGYRTATAFTIGFNKRSLGIYNLYFDQRHEIADQGRHLLETLGQHLGGAVENQRLVSRDRELAVAEERNLLAQELHDSIAQGLAFLNIQVQLLDDSLRRRALEEAAEVVAQIREGVQESYDDVRELLVHFRTRVHQADLESAIAGTLQKFEGQTGIRTRFVHDDAGPPLEPEREIQILHILQEALSNVRKHARATEVRVELHRDVAGFSLKVADDGVGFDVVADPSLSSDQHVGLKIMKERAHRIGGRCDIRSTLDSGTEVTLTLSAQKEAA